MPEQHFGVPLTDAWFTHATWTGQQLAGLINVRPATVYAWADAPAVPITFTKGTTKGNPKLIARESALRFFAHLLHNWPGDIETLAERLASGEDTWWQLHHLALLFGATEKTVQPWVHEPVFELTHLTGPTAVKPNRTLNILASSALKLFRTCVPDGADASALAQAVMRGEEQYVGTPYIAERSQLDESTIRRVPRSELPYVTYPHQEQRQRRRYLSRPTQEWLRRHSI